MGDEAAPRLDRHPHSLAARAEDLGVPRNAVASSRAFGFRLSRCHDYHHLRHYGRVSTNISLNSARAALESNNAMFAIHYASESFFEAQESPMAISAIAVFDLRADSARVFSRTDVEGTSAEQEQSLLARFFSFLSANRDATFLHWNMGGMEFGFESIAKRYQYLEGQEPPITAPVHQMNVDKMIRARHGEDYAPHRRFQSIGTLNDLDMRGFLPGAEEAEAFKRGNWGDLARSASTKAKLIARLFELLVRLRLRTNSSAGRFEFAGESIDAAAAVLRVGERFRDVQIALRKRHAARAPLSFDDEYDDQYLMRALLAVFFDDIRPEDYAPEYAGGRSRVDFLIPDHGLAIELKHTRDGLSDKSLGEQLMTDRERYRGAWKARHLIALVFDPDRNLDNPHALEKDLQREVGSADLAVTVRIFH